MASSTFKGSEDGEIASGALKGLLDVKYDTPRWLSLRESSWGGHAENDPASPRLPPPVYQGRLNSQSSILVET